MRIAAFALVLLAAACGATGVQRFEYPAVGTGQAALPIDSDAFTVTLRRATLAFGPVYFCQSVASSPELCPVAQAELLTVTAIDLLSTTPQPLGQVASLAGAVGTATYDLGWSWFPRDNGPRLAEGIDHSAELEVEIVRKADGLVRTFVAPLELRPTIAGTRTIGATRAEATIDDARWRLVVAGEPRAWWAMVDPAELFALPDGVTIIPDDLRPAKILRQQITSGHPLSLSWEPFELAEPLP